MRNIAIVDADDGAAAVLTEYIQKFSAEIGQEFNIDRFSDAVHFLAEYKSQYAVVFMAMQMPQRDGMSVAVELRKTDKAVSIIFVTDLVQYAPKGYDVDAIAYMLKPVKYGDFAPRFRKALNLYALNQEKDMTISTADGLCRIPSAKLMYVEIVGHRLYYHLVDGMIERTGVLSKVEEELKSYGFLRCNQCYLVNPRFIVGVKGSTVQLGVETLSISRPRRRAFLSELAAWYAEVDGGGYKN